MLFLIVFFYGPVANLLREGLTKDGVFSLDFVIQILTDDYFRHVILFTLWQALLSTLASIVLGLPLAYILAHYEFPLKRVIRALTIVPFVLPAITVALGFALLFGRNGYLNQLLMSLLGLSEPPLPIMYSLTGIVLAHAFYNAPIITRTVHAAWERLDPRYEESARALGASRFYVFKDITLPMILPGLLSGAALVFIFCFLSFPIVLSVGGGRFSTIEVEIYTRVVTRLDPQFLNYKIGAALALIGLVLSLAMTYIYLRVQGSFAKQAEHVRPRPTIPLFAGAHDLLRPTKVLLWLYVLISLALFAGPMLAIVIDSLWEDTPVGGHWTLRWYSYIFTPDYEALLGDSPLRAIVNSISFGLGATAIAVPLGLIFAYLIARLRWVGRRLFDTLLMAPLATSSIVLAFALLRAFSAPPLKLVGTATAVIIAHAVIIFPFIVRALVPVLENLDIKIVEMARSLGASRWRALREIELPLAATGLVAGAVFAFALSLGEMSATLMLARPGLNTMPVAVYRFLSQHSLGAPSAMSTVMIAVSALAFILLERWGERALKNF
ncbi:Putative 2-aminoethylphosphonate transport system permease protein PhnU [bacterium HR07]|nr:Putative 2-aminoethylphosphonate transport system permease protein PhnU [bacterium HR07]